MFNFWKLAYKSVKEQRDQHKVELQQCKSELHHYRAELESYKTNLKQRREERESMISDFQKKLDLVHMLKDEINELKQENEKLERENRRKHYSANENNKYYKELWEKTEEYRKSAENAMELAERANCEVLRLERENEKLKDKLKD